MGIFGGAKYSSTYNYLYGHKEALNTVNTFMYDSDRYAFSVAEGLFRGPDICDIGAQKAFEKFCLEGKKNRGSSDV